MEGKRGREGPRAEKKLTAAKVVGKERASSVKCITRTDCGGWMADRDRPPTQCYNARSRGGIESGADQSSLAQPMAKFGFSQQTSRKCTWGRERTFILILHQPFLGLQFVSLGNLHQRALAARAISVYLIFQFTVREVSKCLHLRIRYVCLGKVITCDRCWTGSNVIRLATRLVYPLMTIASTPFQRPPSYTTKSDTCINCPFHEVQGAPTRLA